MAKNKLMELLGVETPIILAGMAGGVTTPELVAAVSNAGGLGTIGAGYLKPDDLRRQITQTKQLTERPFAVNLFVGKEPESCTEVELEKARAFLRPIQEELEVEEELPLGKLPDMEEQLNILLEEHVPIISFTFGIPDPTTVDRLKNKGILLIGTATTVEEAILNEKQGMDTVVVQGFEAGGHRGTFQTPFDEAMVGTMALIPQVVDHVGIPVIAAGGIMDGRGIVASYALGASGVQLGTAFLTCDESGTNPHHKHELLKRTETETTITKSFSGKPARGFRNRFIEMMAEHDADVPAYPIQNYLTKPLRQKAKEMHNPEFMSLWSGQGTRMSRSMTAHELMQSLTREIREISSEIAGK